MQGVLSGASKGCHRPRFPMLLVKAEPESHMYFPACSSRPENCGTLQ